MAKIRCRKNIFRAPKNKFGKGLVKSLPNAFGKDLTKPLPNLFFGARKIFFRHLIFAITFSILNIFYRNIFYKIGGVCEMLEITFPVLLTQMRDFSSKLRTKQRETL